MIMNGFMRIVARVVLVSYLIQILAPVIHACEVMAQPMSNSLDTRFPMSGVILNPNTKLMAKDETHNITSLPPKTNKIALPPNRPVQPSEIDRKKAARIIKDFRKNSANGTYTNPQADTFQYRLSIKTRNASREQFDLKLSRKSKGAEGKFERLHLASLDQGILHTESNGGVDDIFLNLLRGGSVARDMAGVGTARYSWNIPGIGIINIGFDGKVAVNSDESTPILSTYDMILKTSEDLFLQHLNVAALTLNSPQTTIISRLKSTDGIKVNRLEVNQQLRNLGDLSIKQLTGKGSINNHGHMHFMGDTDNPAVLGIQSFKNIKLDGFDKPTVDGSNLHVTSDNKEFANGENSKFSINGSFTVDDSNCNSSFLNYGSLEANADIALNRKAINYASWQANQMSVNQGIFINKKDLTILDGLTVNSQLENEGEVTIKNNLLGFGTLYNSNKLMFDGIKHSLAIQDIINKNQGIITAKGPAQSTVRRFHNDGTLHTNGMIMSQQSAEFTNTGTWKNTGSIHTGTTKLSNTGIFDWQNGTWTFTNLLFIQARRSEIIRAMLNKQKSNKNNTNQLLTEDTFPPVDFTNNGTWILANIAYTSKLAMHNHGTLHLKNGSYKFWELNNHKDVLASSGLGSTLTIHKGTSRGKFSASNHSLNIQESFSNEGEADLRTLEGEGKFNNTGTLQFNGVTSNPSRLTIQEIHNHRTGKIIATSQSESTVKRFVNEGALQTNGIQLTQPSAIFTNTGTWKNTGDINTGSTNLSNTGKLFWQNGIWTFMLPQSKEELREELFNLSIGLYSGPSALRRNLTPVAFSNYGQWVLDNITYTSKLVMHNYGTLSLKNGSYNFWELNNHKDVLASSDIASTLTIHKGTSRGRFSAPNHSLNVQESFTNEGEATIQNLGGEGKFNNSGTLQFQNNSTKFSHLTLREFHNQEMGTVVALGSLKNQKTNIFNEGKLETKDKYIQFEGTFTNSGTWKHTGFIQTVITKLSNTGKIIWSEGIWGFGTLTEQSRARYRQNGNQDDVASSIQHINNGTWVFDTMSCAPNISMVNHGILGLMGGTLSFWDLINHNVMELHAGQYTVANRLENNGTLKFLHNDWVISDNNDHQNSPHRLIAKNTSGIDKTLFGSEKIQFGPQARIENQKALTYDVLSLPKTFAAEGDLNFTKQYYNRRFLEDLYLIERANKKVTFFCSLYITTCDYEFANIGHLHIYASPFIWYNPFTVHHSLKAPALTLSIFGNLVCGLNNDKMGTIAATEGPLNITAMSIDARFGKIWGKGPTSLKSTHGDILIGAEARKIDEEIKKTYQNYNVAGITYHGDYSIGVCNEAYVASEDKITINSAKDIVFDFGQILSAKDADLTAARNIQNLAGKIFSLESIRIQGREYKHLRKQPTHSGVCNAYDWAYPGSGPAILESLGTIQFYVDDIHNLASTIRGRDGIFINDSSSLNSATEYTEEPINLTIYWFNGGGWGNDWGWKRTPLSTQSCVVQSGDIIRMNLGKFKITGITYGPTIAITAGTGLFHNQSYTRETFNSTETLIHDFTQHSQSLAQGHPVLQVTKLGEVKSILPFGPSLPPNYTTRPAMLADAQTQRLYQRFATQQLKFNLLNELPLGFQNLFVQSLFGSVAGKIPSRKEYGDNTALTLYQRGIDYAAALQTSFINMEDVQKAPFAMFLTGLKQVGTDIQQVIYLILPPSDINPYRSPGDAAGNEFSCVTEDKQSHINNRIYARDKIDVKSLKADIERRTDSRTEVRQVSKDTCVTEQISNPQQQFICENGDINTSAHNNNICVGTLTQAGQDYNQTAVTQRIIEEQLVLQKTVETNKEEQSGFGSTTTTHEKETTHSGVPTTSYAGRNINKKAGQLIEETGSQDIAGQEISFNAPKTHLRTNIIKNTKESSKETTSSTSQQSSFLYQETPFVAEQFVSAPVVKFKGGETTLEGVRMVGQHFIDETTRGVFFKMAVQELQYFQEMVNESAMASSRVGTKGGYDFGVPCRPLFEKIERRLNKDKASLREQLSTPHTLAEDGTQRYVHPMPGIDNACGFYSLLADHPEFTEGVNPRQLAVQKLLEGLENSDLQGEICDLLAPEIWELYIKGGLEFIPGAHDHLQENGRRAEALRHALAETKDNLGLQDTAHDADYILSLTPEEFINIEGSLRFAKQKMDEQKNSELEWAKQKETVAAFIQHIIGMPGWELGYSSEHYDNIHEGQAVPKPSGAMDALALVLGANLKIYRKDGNRGSEQLRAVHTKTIPNATQTIELFHNPYQGTNLKSLKTKEESRPANHFDRLRTEPITMPELSEYDAGQMMFESVDWGDKKPEIVGKYIETVRELKSWQTNWAEHHQVIPNEAIVVVALAVAIATQGMGVKFLTPMLSNITAATGLKLTATGIAMVNAGFTAICSQAASTLARTGDFTQVARDLTSTQGIKSIGISMASAGLCDKLSTAWGVDMNPSLKELAENPTKPVFTDFLQAQAIKCGVDAGLNVTIGGANPQDAITSALKQAPIAAAAAWASYNIGDLGFTGKLTSEQQDLLHSVVGGAYGAVLNPDKPLEGMTSGAANAFIASKASKMLFGTSQDLKTQAEQEVLKQGLPLTDGNVQREASNILHQETALTAIGSATLTALITKDAKLVSTGITTAANVTENNCIPSMTKSLVVAQTSGSSTGEFWQDEFDDPRDVYYQRALNSAFPYEEPEKINAIVRYIRQFRKTNPRLANLIYKSLEGVGTGMQYAYYTTAILTGFAMGEMLNPLGGGVIGASLSLATAKSLESSMHEGFKFMMTNMSKSSQEFIDELIPFLPILGIKTLKGVPFKGSIPSSVQFRYNVDNYPNSQPIILRGTYRHINGGYSYKRLRKAEQTILQDVVLQGQNPGNVKFRNGQLKVQTEVLSVLPDEGARNLFTRLTGQGISKDCVELTEKFSDGRVVTFRTEGRSGHPKIEITSLGNGSIEKVREKITFKQKELKIIFKDSF